MLVVSLGQVGLARVVALAQDGVDFRLPRTKVGELRIRRLRPPEISPFGSTITSAPSGKSTGSVGRNTPFS